MSFVFEATQREEIGKGASRRLRHAGQIPAVIYGPGKEPVSVVLDHDKVFHAQEKAEFYSEVLTIVVAGTEHKVKVQDIQRHAFKPKLVHLDFKFA
ncbi:50S ribosomal protein L25 [Paraferrimonas sedimenticola]|uniref:Large ribosomal subunit protein bL25 n=1 Tax=Paraferrimonas sedimenticola TaxID=375674 RepID=A0AA37RW99_9GAMM|nr:50S ribosomal protein L25 [Paraferrimonas sedimenticola]GLP96469.1 50S ribosomal protein L25 [Paraferrimonas sedimenticola]